MMLGDILFKYSAKTFKFYTSVYSEQSEHVLKVCWQKDYKNGSLKISDNEELMTTLPSKCNCEHFFPLALCRRCGHLWHSVGTMMHCLRKSCKWHLCLLLQPKSFRRSSSQDLRRKRTLPWIESAKEMVMNKPPPWSEIISNTNVYAQFNFNNWWYYGSDW